MFLFQCLIALHAAGGFTALLTGPVPMLAAKGGRLHRCAGRIFAAAMVVTTASALALAVVIWSVFFAGLAVFAFFLIYGGVRAIRFLRGQPPSLADDLVCGMAAVCSAALLGYGILAHSTASVFFGVGGCFLAQRQWQRLHDPDTDWRMAHLTSMAAAYLATLTAFLALNLSFLPQALVFIGPTLLGAPLIVWAKTRYRRVAA
jgi:uncharacterized membrane protein